ncbi:MAG: glycosyltransferase [Saprospiraceae bacterium]|nr:glycosyltransferase [Saprospiraceae bacterium]
MHILFIPTWFETPTHPTSGKAVKDLAYALARYGHDLTIHILYQSPESLPLTQTFDNQIELWHSHCDERGKLYPVWNTYSIRSYNKVLQNYTKKHGVPDLIHIHSYPSLAIAAYFNKIYGIPFFYTEHSSKVAQDNLNYIEKTLIRKYTIKANGVSAVGHHLAHTLDKIIHRPVKVIPNTLDFDYFYPDKKIHTEDLIMINLLNKNKQVDLGIKTYLLWQKHHPHAKLHIIGDGPEKEDLTIQINHLSQSDHILLYGEQHPNEWLHLLQSSACLMLLSKFETFGVVAAEALACGVPVVALENNGINEITNNEEIAILPVTSTEREVLDGIEQVIKKGNVHFINLREKLKSRLDYPEVASQYLSFYNIDSIKTT